MQNAQGFGTSWMCWTAYCHGRDVRRLVGHDGQVKASQTLDRAGPCGVSGLAPPWLCRARLPVLVGIWGVRLCRRPPCFLVGLTKKCAARGWVLVHLWLQVSKCQRQSVPVSSCRSLVASISYQVLLSKVVLVSIKIDSMILIGLS